MKDTYIQESHIHQYLIDLMSIFSDYMKHACSNGTLMCRSWHLDSS